MPIFRVLARKLLRVGQVRYASSGNPHLRAVPFKRSLHEARNAYSSYHQSSLSCIPSLTTTVKQRFLPFWAVSLLAESKILSASLAFDTVDQRYNIKTGKYENHMKSTRLEHVEFEAMKRPVWQNIHDASNHVPMQVYASYDYDRECVSGMTGPGTLTDAGKLTGDMVEQVDGGVRGLEEFRMRPGKALDLAKETVDRDASAYAKTLLRRMYRADRVVDMQLETTLHNVQVAPVYVPTFIFESRYLNQNLRTFVHGSTLQVGGERLLFYAPKVGLAAAAVVGLTTGSVAGVLTATIAGVLYPALTMCYGGWCRQREEKNYQMEEEKHQLKTWGEEYVNAYGMWDEYLRQEHARWSNAREQQERANGDSDSYGENATYWDGWRDPLGRTRRRPDHIMGYYSTLGLSPGATEAEVKAAFRALALKHHPDRFQDPEQAGKAIERFHEIMNAYKVLLES